MQQYYFSVLASENELLKSILNLSDVMVDERAKLLVRAKTTENISSSERITLYIYTLIGDRTEALATIEYSILPSRKLTVSISPLTTVGEQERYYDFVVNHVDDWRIGYLRKIGDDANSTIEYIEDEA